VSSAQSQRRLTPHQQRQRRQRLTVLLSVIIVVLAFLVGWERPGSDTPNFKVVGSCNSGNGIMVGVGSGFTPNGPYITTMWGSDGKMLEYGTVKNPGYADSNGHTPGWKYDCAEAVYPSKMPPAAGTRHVRITDLTTGKSTDKVAFTVGKG
jgi:hypothetical protein